MLLLTGYDFFRYFSISGLIAEERGRYYKTMRQVETSGNDMTYFIDYYSSMLSQSVERMKEHLLGHVLTEKRMQTLQAAGRLNERQLKGARWLLEGKTAQVTNMRNIKRHHVVNDCNSGIVLLDPIVDGTEHDFPISSEVVVVNR